MSPKDSVHLSLGLNNTDVWGVFDSGRMEVGVESSEDDVGDREEKRVVWFK